MTATRIAKLDKFYEDLYGAATKLSCELVVVARVNELLSGIVSLIDEIRYQPTNTNYVEGIKQHLKVLEKYDYHLIISPQLGEVLALGKIEILPSPVPKPAPGDVLSAIVSELKPPLVVRCKKCGNRHEATKRCTEVILMASPKKTPYVKKTQRVTRCSCCGETGHNELTCQNKKTRSAAVAEQAPVQLEDSGMARCNLCDFLALPAHKAPHAASAHPGKKVEWTKATNPPDDEAAIEGQRKRKLYGGSPVGPARPTGSKPF